MKYVYDFKIAEPGNEITSIPELKDWLHGYIKHTEKKVKHMREIKHHNSEYFHSQVLFAKNLLKKIGR